MRLTLRRLAWNWKLKLTALGLAVLLWAVVSAEQVTARWLPVPVEAVIRAPGLVQVGGPRPAEVRVRFVGPGRELWELALERPTLVLTVREAAEGGTYVLEPQMVRVPRGLVVTAEDVRPATVRLDLQRLGTRELPVRVRLDRGTTGRWVLADSVVVDPALVRVTGPMEELDRLEAVYTRPLALTSGDTAFDRRLALDTVGLRGAAPDVDQVRVTGRAERRVERAIAAVRVALPPSLAAAPPAVTVTLRGPEAAVVGIDAASLLVVPAAGADLRAVPPGGVEVPLAVAGLPPGVSAEVSPGRVRVSPALFPAPAAAPGLDTGAGTRRAP